MKTRMFAVPERFTSLLLPSTLRSHGEKMVRYFISGLTVSLGYTVTVIALVEGTHWDPGIANIVSVVLWTPISFVLQRNFSFRFQGANAIPALKFAFLFVAKLVVSTLIVDVAAHFASRAYIAGVFANWVLVPLITYALLNCWVFRGTAVANQAGIE